MAGFNWAKAKKRIPAGPGTIERAVRGENRVAAHKARRAIREAKAVVQDPELWPATVTVPDGEGGIQTLIFHNRQEADLAGFSWVGRVR